MYYCPTPTLHLNLALTGDCAFLLSPKKTHSVWFISIWKVGTWGNVLKSHLHLVIPVIPVSLYKFMSSFVTKTHTHPTHTQPHTHTHPTTHPHTPNHTPTHTPNHTHTHTQPHTQHTHTHTPNHTHTPKHTPTHINKHIYIYILLHTHTQ